MVRDDDLDLVQDVSDEVEDDEASDEEASESVEREDEEDLITDEDDGGRFSEKHEFEVRKHSCIFSQHFFHCFPVIERSSEIAQFNLHF